MDAFFAQLNDEQKASIPGVLMDGGGSYRKLVNANLPNAAIVFDHFYLKMKLNTAVDEGRRAEWNSADKLHKRLIKSSRYLLLSNKSNLDNKGRSKFKLLQDANKSISTAYILKEQFSAVYMYKKEGWASGYLMKWCELAEASGLNPFIRLAKSFKISKRDGFSREA